MTNTQKLNGIILMCIGVACLSLNDAMAKFLIERYSPLQVLFIRNVIALPIAVVLVMVTRGRTGLMSKRPGIHLVRGVFWVLATVLFFTSIKHLGLATSTALIFLAPLLIVAIAALFFGEQADWVRWASVGIGFIGAMIIVRPGTTEFDPMMILSLVAALMAAFLMISARWVDPDESVWTLLLYLTGASVAVSACVVPFFWSPIAMADTWLFLGVALFGTAGMTLMTQAFRHASAYVVAPLDYTALLWAIFFGWILFRDIPDLLTIIGACVIIVGGLMTIFHNPKPAQQA